MNSDQISEESVLQFDFTLQKKKKQQQQKTKQKKNNNETK